MASQAEIQAEIDQIVAGGRYRASEMRPLLTSMLDFSSSGQTQVFDGLVANNTTMEDTTLVLDYGVNIVITATLTDDACKLPQPVAGKKVYIVNNSLLQISVFPDYSDSVAGKINNGTVGASVTVPANGKVYEFICIASPQPGAWAASF